MTENHNNNSWSGRATGAFRLLNWELFVKPRKWLMLSGFIIMIGAVGQVGYEIFSDRENQERIKRNKRVLELAEEVKRKSSSSPAN